MQTQRRIRADLESRAPWSPLSVAAIALFLPPGAALLTILNLRRLHTIDGALARQLSVAVIVIFALGSAILISLSFPKLGQGGSIDSNASPVLPLGVALASYLSQQPSFRAWRQANRRAPTSSAFSALALALLYSLIWVAIALPLLLIVVGLEYATGVQGHS